MNFDALVAQYENGHLSRRDLLAALALLVAAPGATSGAASAIASATADKQAIAKPIGAIKSMNHVSVFVPDVKKAVQFYQDLFGMPDPDGIRVQLQDVKYIGGTGVLGDKPPK